MAFSIRASWRENYKQWLAARIPAQNRSTLHRRNIYILPTANGMMYLFAAGLVFVAAINYAVSLAFGLAFLMVSVFILAILHTFNNLNQLILLGKFSPAVYCEEQAAFKVELSRLPAKKHEAIELSFEQGLVTHADLIDQDRVVVDVFVKADRRGEFRAPFLRITTYFPLGLCRAWSFVDLDMYCLVYPKPVVFSMNQFNTGSSGNDDSAIIKDGSEDYYGLREYVPGDSLRQVAWKNLARGQSMHVKQFVDYVDSKIWLDWDMFYGFSTEERLSRLCYCVLKLSKSNNAFGLKLPGVEIAPDTGPDHKIKLLRTLALFGG
ncbi:MAG: DUF58 domain-containing protein [Gammaproteobacteria bacterium]|nr:DUF58 domain-containing protein [Gammaproteobacteria bacterium]